jgi:beta-glucosidase
LQVIASPLDFVGFNFYRPYFYALASDQPPGWQEIPFARSHPSMFNRWLVLGPEVLHWGPKLVQSLWDVPEIYITENGCASNEVFASDGKIYDTVRIMFRRACLTWLQHATSDGVPVKGYFQWTTMDNLPPESRGLGVRPTSRVSAEVAVGLDKAPI